MTPFFTENKRALLLGVLLLALIGLYSCKKDRQTLKEITNESLRPQEHTAIVINPNGGRVTVLKRSSGHGIGGRSSPLRGGKHEPEAGTGTIIKSVTGARGIRISIDSQGNPTITARTKGWIFEPGLGIGYAGGYPRISGDVQLAFSRRHGAIVGLSYPLHGRGMLSAYAAYSYNLYSNSSVFVGVDDKKQIVFGIRIKI